MNSKPSWELSTIQTSCAWAFAPSPPKNAAPLNNMLTANKTRRSDNAEYQVFCKASSRLFADASPLPVAEPTVYAFSFPLCDLLICELDTPEASDTNFYTVTKVTRHLNARTATALPAVHVAVRGALSVAEYILQKVVRRKPVPFLKSEKDLKNLGCYILETLECGHTVEVHPERN
jgi:hypothetical protein